MTRVLVSGGTGFVGRFIIEHLLANGYEVTVGGRSPPPAGFYSQPVSHVPLRLDADADQAGAFDDIYYFVHAAFEHVEGRYRGGEGDDPTSFRRANLDGSVRLFEEARAAGVRRCVFLSSRAVYGETAPPVVAETSPVEPDTFYGQVKLATENALKSMTDHSFVTTSLRVTGVYGPRARDENTSGAISFPITLPADRCQGASARKSTATMSPRPSASCSKPNRREYPVRCSTSPTC